MQLARSVVEHRRICDDARVRGGSVGLVPTMGALHSGHLRLIQALGRQCSDLVVSIFVNPTQFGPNEDFQRYPRQFEQDLDLCRAAGARAVFAPDVDQMYPPGEQTRVQVRGLTEALCGASRPGHFEGVATVVAKLFAATGPCTAIFGRKDYQQYKVIERMCRDLLLPVRLVAHPTVRESDGLALSSRNAYLGTDERKAAVAIPRGLAKAQAAFVAGEHSVDALTTLVRDEVTKAGLRIDYVTVAHADELVPLPQTAAVDQRALLALAVYSGTTRLIDNLVLGEDPAPSLGDRS